MASGLVPNAFEKRTRTVGPPTERWITWRSVLPANPGAGGMLRGSVSCGDAAQVPNQCGPGAGAGARGRAHAGNAAAATRDRKSTRLNSSHVRISYAVFCLKKKKHISRLQTEQT